MALSVISSRTRQFRDSQPSDGENQNDGAIDLRPGDANLRDHDLQFAIARAHRAFENLKRFRRTSGWAFDDQAESKSKRSAGRAIERAAIYPDSHILHFSILAGLVLVEGLANAYFFSTGSDLGLLGGWLQAITVSFTNVIAAFFIIGYLCMRHLMNPQKTWFFIPALIGLPIGIAFIVILNLAAAHYRDLLELNAATLAIGDSGVTGQLLAPLPAVLANPFGLQTLEAYLLLTLGLTFAAIAAFKGRTFDDAIPGYGVVQRKAERAARDLNRCMKRIAGTKNAMPDQVQDAQNLLMDMATDFAEDRPGRNERA